MRFGCCTNMISTFPDGTGIEHVEKIKKAGYDYIELPLAQIMDLSAKEFITLEKKMEEFNMPCEACNNFFPARIRLTGENCNINEILEYVEGALNRAALLGAKTIVFGSAGAKNVPAGFSHEEALSQILFLLRKIGRYAEKSGITIVIEPLNKLESNIINTVEDGLKLAKGVNRENVKLLVDYYHLSVEKEGLEVLKKAGESIRHVHFARPEGRVFPCSQDSEEYALFFEKLKEIGYEGGISIEAYSNFFTNDLKKSLDLLKGVRF